MSATTLTAVDPLKESGTPSWPEDPWVSIRQEKVKVRMAKESELEQIAMLVMDSFSDDNMFRYLWKDRDGRDPSRLKPDDPHALPTSLPDRIRFTTIFLRLHFIIGQVWVVESFSPRTSDKGPSTEASRCRLGAEGGELAAYAMWLPPGAEVDPGDVALMWKTGGLKFLASKGVRFLKRMFLDVVSKTDNAINGFLKPQGLGPTDRWYLSTIGVHKAHQGKGYASLLIRPFFPSSQSLLSHTRNYPLSHRSKTGQTQTCWPVVLAVTMPNAKAVYTKLGFKDRASMRHGVGQVDEKGYAPRREGWLCLGGSGAGEGKDELKGVGNTIMAILPEDEGLEAAAKKVET